MISRALSIRYAWIGVVGLPVVIGSAYATTALPPVELCAAHHADTLNLGLVFEADGRDSSAPIAVTLRLPPMRDTSMVLALPNEWAGRSHLYQNIVNPQALSPNTRLLSTSSPNRLSLIAPRGEPAVVTWRLSATAPSSSSGDAHNHSDIGASWAQIVGYDALVLPAFAEDVPVCTTLEFRGLAPRAAVGTSFGVAVAGGPVVMRGALSDLRSAVYTMALTPSTIHAYSSAIAGGMLTVLVRGHHAIDDSTLVSRVQQVIAEERAFWGLAPPPNYLVTIGVAPRGSLGGVRLANAFVADIDSTQVMTERVQALFAHELMHEWIGSGILHASHALPDGQLYWFTEGFDEFLSHRVMHAARLLSDTGYVGAVNRDLSDHALSTARDSSWDTVVRGFWLDQALEREPYARGELIALALNTEIVHASHGRTTLDSLLRTMATRPAAQFAGGLTPEMLYRELGTQIGEDRVRSIVERTLVGGIIALPNDALGVCMRPAIVERSKWDPGFDLAASLAARRVLRVRPDGPAAKAGLRDSLQIVGINAYRGDESKQLGVRVLTGSDTSWIRYLPAGAPVPVQQWSFNEGCPGR